MNMLLNLESPVTTAHRAKLAYIYVRQSTAGQVRQHQESTELQYRLVDRAALFGWPKERIEVIDDDLGKSGTSSAQLGIFGGFTCVESLFFDRVRSSCLSSRRSPGRCAAKGGKP